MHACMQAMHVPSALDATSTRLDQLLRTTQTVLEAPINREEHGHTQDRLLAELSAEVDDSAGVLRTSQQLRSHLYYKTVAKVNGRYLSIFDGQTEFRLGERTARVPCRGHRGAFFAYAEARHAHGATFPTESKLLYAPRAVLRLFADESHDCARFAHGKKQQARAQRALCLVARDGQSHSLVSCQLWSFTPLNEVNVAALSARRPAPGRRRGRGHRRATTPPARRAPRTRRTGPHHAPPTSWAVVWGAPPHIATPAAAAPASGFRSQSYAEPRSMAEGTPAPPARAGNENPRP